MRIIASCLPGILAAAVLAATPSAASAAPTAPAPTARTAQVAASPLSSVASLILTNLAGGAVSKIGGDGFGAALAALGFEDANSAKFREINAKLDEINTKVDRLQGQVESIANQLAEVRLNTVRLAASPIVSKIRTAQGRLRELTNGSITTAELRVRKRAELLALIGELSNQQDHLNHLIYDAHAHDIIDSAGNAERHSGNRFWDTAASERVQTVIDYYQGVAAELLLLRVELEESHLTATTALDVKWDTMQLVKRMVEAQERAFASQQANRPPLLPAATTGVGYQHVLIDTEADPNGHHLVWTYVSGVAIVNSFLDMAGRDVPGGFRLPTMSELRRLTSLRPGGKSPSAYLREERWHYPESCTFTGMGTWHNFYSTDVAGPYMAFAKRNMYRQSFELQNGNAHTEVQKGCVLGVRQLAADERYW
jgi:hypothetical protein